MSDQAKRREASAVEDEVTEAGIESFPASDPPAYNAPGRNKPTTGRPMPGTNDVAPAPKIVKLPTRGVGNGPWAKGFGRNSAIAAGVLLLALVIAWAILI